MSFRSGRHFLQIPGPTNVPDRVLRAMDMPVIDHRGPDFAHLTREVLAGLKRVFKTESDVVVFPASGTGAWEAALANTLSPGDQVLAFETGQFAMQWYRMTVALGLAPELVPGDWRRGVDPDALEARLRADKDRAIKAVTVLHNETSTGVASRIPELRKAIDRAGHPALFMVDTISSLASMDYRHDEWGVDVTVGGSQKGLMLPPGLSFNAISRKARAAAKEAKLPKYYWRWEAMIESNQTGYFPHTPATNMLYGLREALRMLEEEGLDNVFDRHARLAEATRRAVRAWGLEINCLNSAEYSDTITAVLLPEGYDANQLRALILDRFNMSLGMGFGPLGARLFRIGHLGDFNELMLAGVLAGVEMGLASAGVPFTKGGVQAALEYLSGAPAANAARQAAQRGHG
ncbi:MAG: pyridoxal-phosphate-dependent aminotransferase family protein [Sulfurifustaceae bacterium]